MRKLVAYLTLAVCLALPASALAGGGQRLVNDCTDNGRIDGNYSPGEYKDALDNLPTDVDEYTDCRDVIRQSQLSNTGTKPEHKAIPPANPETGPPTAAQKQQVEQQIATQRARFARGKGLRIGGRQVTPGVISSQVGAPGLGTASTDLPISVLIMLVALGLLTAVGIAYFGRDSLRAGAARLRRPGRGRS